MKTIYLWPRSLVECIGRERRAMGETKIEWTTKTWNPTRGCSRISPGCGKGPGQGGCYAERVAYRFAGPGQRFDGYVRLTGHGDPQWSGRVSLIESKLHEPLTWREPARIFVNSMSDLHHETLTDEEIAQPYAIMALSPWHTYQVLTKRSDRMRRFSRECPGLVRETVERVFETLPQGAARAVVRRMGGPGKAASWPLPNVHLGVSVEDQKRHERVDDLRETNAAVRFISYEPALELVTFDLRGIDWLIVGGESGPGSRSFDLAWARSVVKQCKAACVACFVKQMGQNRVSSSNEGTATCSPELTQIRTRKGGDMSEWPIDLRVREFPKSVAP